MAEGHDSGKTARWALPAILCLYLVFGVIHALSTPFGTTGYQDAPDEAAHLSYIRTLASGRMPSMKSPHGSLASTSPDYEWHQPPLYYAIAVPFSALGAAGETGETVVRLLSLGIGLCSLVLIFMSARLLRPDDDLVAICAVGVAAFTPAHFALLSVINNDSLLELLFTAVLYLAIRFQQNLKVAPKVSQSILFGVLLGAAILTKTTALLLVPVILVSYWLAMRAAMPARSVIKHAAITFGSALIICGWWFARNAALYGELLPLHAFQQSFGGTALAVDAANGKLGLPIDGWSGYWLLVGKWCFMSFWAVYGTRASASVGAPMWLPDGVYLLTLAFCVAAFAGIIRLHMRRKAVFTVAQRGGVYLQFLTLGLVTAAYLLFVSKYFQTQGRYLYPAMSAICLILSMGWLELFPQKYKRGASGGLLALLCMLCVVFLLQTSGRPHGTMTATSSIMNSNAGRVGTCDLAEAFD